MERQIVFRGKRKDNGKWIHGDLQLGDGDHIPMIGEVCGGHDPVYYQVEEETIGQLTGVNDKDRIMIFEGDILQCPSVPNIPLEVRYNTLQGAFCLVEHTHTEGALLGTCPLGKMLRHYPDMRIIGNRFDNPELISDKQ